MSQRKRKKEVIIPVVEQMTTWKVISGGITLKNKQHYDKDETFQAFDQDVPMAFRDIVKPITPLVKRQERPQPKYSLREVVPTPDEEDESGYVPLYDIINENDKVISEKPLPKKQAAKILDKLNE